MTVTALFEPDGSSRFLPTDAAIGPWDPDLVHGAAVAGLFAGQLTPDESTLARLTVEIIAPVPHTPLTLTRTEPAGGKRVRRQAAAIVVDGREVATATAVTVRRGDIDLPQSVLDQPSPFDPGAVPDLTETNRRAADIVGWESLDSQALVFKPVKTGPDEPTQHWISLTVPVVAGTKLRGTELAAVASDYGQNAVYRHLSLKDWSFRNAEQTLHLAREPVGTWIGMRCDCVIQPVGAGFNTADLFDEQGRVGTSAAALVVERRATG